MSHRSLLALKLALAGAATLLLLWDWLRTRGSDAYKWHRLLDLGLGSLSILSMLAWVNFGALQPAVHHGDIFHYYLGGKYFDELRYTELYRCCAAADLEAGLAPAGGAAWIRDLSTNDLVRVSDAKDSFTACRARFAEERWRQFALDVGYFRQALGPRWWPEMFNDHGYNPPPTWTMVGGGALARLGPATQSQMALLVAVDGLLISTLFAIVWWTFGWRTAAVASLWIGLSHSTGFNWLGGCFLRWDWIVATVLALCLARRQRFAWAGLALGYASLVRVLPALLLGGLVIRQLVRPTDRDGWRALGRTLMGFAAACAIVVPLTGVAVGTGPFDLGPWREFREDNLRQVNSPTIAKVGMRTLFAFEPSTRLSALRDLSLDAPWDTWRLTRRRVFVERLPYFLVAVGLWLALLAWALRRSKDWEALVLGVGLVPIAIEAASYYQVILAGYALLWPLHRLAGVFLAAAAGLTCLAPAFTDWPDELHVTISLVVMLLVAAVTLVVGLATRPDEPIR